MMMKDYLQEKMIVEFGFENYWTIQFCKFCEYTNNLQAIEDYYHKCNFMAIAEMKEQN